MGGVSQDTFARRTIEAKSIFACTHLVCPKPEGRKYEAAQNWGVSAVDPKWLLASAATATRQKESDYPPATDTPVPAEEAVDPPPEQELPYENHLAVRTNFATNWEWTINGDTTE